MKGKKMNTKNLQQKDDQMIEIDLLELGKVLLGHIKQIVIMTILGGILIYGATMLFVTPTYRSSFSAYVNNRNTSETVSSINSSDVSAAQTIAKTYASIIVSRDIVNATIEQAGINEEKYSYQDIFNSISASVEESTQLIHVSVTIDDPKVAYQLASALSEIAPEYAAEIVEGTSMKIVNSAVLPTNQFSPNVKKNTVIGAGAGLLLAVIYIIAKTLMDQTVKNEEDLEKKFGVPVIGSIPDFETAGHNGYSNYGYYGKNNKTTDNSVWEKAKKKSFKRTRTVE